MIVAGFLDFFLFYGPVLEPVSTRAKSVNSNSVFWAGAQLSGKMNHFFSFFSFSDITVIYTKNNNKTLQRESEFEKRNVTNFNHERGC